MGNATDRVIGIELGQQLVGVEFHILAEDHDPSAKSDMMRLVVQIKEDDVENAAFGILFTLSTFSFCDARPIEKSDVQYQENDEWTIHDFLRNLSFAYGKLQFYANYVRGRVMNTDITLSSDGLMIIHTYHRGKSASRWVRRLQGGNTLSLKASVVMEDNRVRKHDNASLSILKRDP